MKIRVNTRDGGAVTLDAPPKAWFYPEDPSIDVCALRDRELHHGTPSDVLDIGSISLHSMIVGPQNAKALGLSLGDEVFIAGAFIGRVGYRKNIPVVRIATIAAMPEEPVDFASPRRPAYLIETRSLGGTSGSPVFLNIEHQRKFGGERHGLRLDALPHGDESKRRQHLIMPYYLLGMIIFIHGGSYAQDFVSEADSDIHPLKDVEFNAGIAVALPVSAILDLLNSKQVKEVRMAELVEKKRASGARPASAPVRKKRPSPPASDGNPKHRSDFNSLLNAAVRKPPPKD
jgi:hypothetical protein